MIIYENKGLSFVPQKWWGVINLYTLSFLAVLTACLWLGIIDSWSFFFWLFCFFWMIGFLVYLYTVSKARPRIIETRTDSINIIWSKYFSVKSTAIKNEDVKIEYYKSPFRRRFGVDNLYLYFYSRTDKSVDIELNENFHALGRIVESIQQEQKISLSGRELEFLEEYRKQLKFEQTTFGKIAKVLVPGVMIAILLLIVYTCGDGG